MGKETKMSSLIEEIFPGMCLIPGAIETISSSAMIIIGMTEEPILVKDEDPFLLTEEVQS